MSDARDPGVEVAHGHSPLGKLGAEGVLEVRATKMTSCRRRGLPRPTHRSRSAASRRRARPRTEDGHTGGRAANQARGRCRQRVAITAAAPREPTCSATIAPAGNAKPSELPAAGRAARGRRPHADGACRATQGARTLSASLPVRHRCSEASADRVSRRGRSLQFDARRVRGDVRHRPEASTRECRAGDPALL